MVNYRVIRKSGRYDIEEVLFESLCYAKAKEYLDSKEREREHVNNLVKDICNYDDGIKEIIHSSFCIVEIG